MTIQKKKSIYYLFNFTNGTGRFSSFLSLLCSIEFSGKKYLVTKGDDLTMEVATWMKKIKKTFAPCLFVKNNIKKNLIVKKKKNTNKRLIIIVFLKKVLKLSRRKKRQKTVQSKDRLIYRLLLFWLLSKLYFTRSSASAATTRTSHNATTSVSWSFQIWSQSCW